MGQFNSLTEAACLVQRWWCEEQPLFTLWHLSLSFFLSLTGQSVILPFTWPDKWIFMKPPKRAYANPEAMSHAHTHADTHAWSHQAELLPLRGVRGFESLSEISLQKCVTNQTELMELWYMWALCTCECYNSLPFITASTAWVASFLSLSVSASLPFRLSIFVIFFTTVLWLFCPVHCNILYMYRNDMNAGLYWTVRSFIRKCDAWIPNQHLNVFFFLSIHFV